MKLDRLAYQVGCNLHFYQDVERLIPSNLATFYVDYVHEILWWPLLALPGVRVAYEEGVKHSLDHHP